MGKSLNQEVYMKKKLIWISIATMVILAGCSGLGSSKSDSSPAPVSSSKSSGSGFLSGIFNRIPAELQEDVYGRVDENNELYGFGSGASDKLGAAAGQMRAIDSAKADLTKKVRKEVQATLNTYCASLDAYTQTLVKPAIPDMTGHATELSMYNILQKGAWEDDKKVYALVTVAKNDVHSNTRNVFQTFLDNMSKKISSAKGQM